MTKNENAENSKSRSSDLRAQAKARLMKFTGLNPEFRKMTPEELIEELSVHQIELEMQNEELKNA